MVHDSTMLDAVWTPLHAKLHRLLRLRRLLYPEQRVLVAVSGGQDSLCLIQLLLDLQAKWRWQLAIGHCDHRWRSDSQANAKHVEALAQEWGLPFYQHTAANIPTSEAAARHWRYQVLLETAQIYDYSAIATGHTASDRAETLLFNLMRGSGLDGLQALTWQRMLATDVQVVRPLLALTRTDTASVCRARNLPVWEDETNHDWTYTRNRIRQDLLPYLQQHLNTQVEQHLARTAELLQADVSYLEQMATQLRQQIQHPTQASLSRSSLQTAPLALQRRVIRQFLQIYLPSHPNFAQVEKLLVLLDAPNRSQSDPFPGGLIAIVENEWLTLKPSPGNCCSRNPADGFGANGEELNL
jgi:tRNA(Ile)-lysidine synthase